MAVSQFVVINGQNNRRPDVVVFVNGFLRYFLMANYVIKNERGDSVVREDEIYDWFIAKGNAALCDYEAKPFEFVRKVSATATGGLLARYWSPTPPAPHARVRRHWTHGWHRSQPGWLGGTASTHGSSPPRMPVPTSSLSRRRAAATPGCGAMPIR